MRDTITMFESWTDNGQVHPIDGIGKIGTWLKSPLLYTAPSQLMDEPLQPKIYIIAGPNGAGKITFANAFLPSFANYWEFLNTDLTAAGLASFAPET